jgi:hypothetical protein
MDEQLHSPARRLIELRIAHAELDGRIDALIGASTLRVIDIGGAGIAVPPVDELTLRRLKKQRLALRYEIARLELARDPDEPA